MASFPRLLNEVPEISPLPKSISSASAKISLNEESTSSKSDRIMCRESSYDDGPEK